MYKINNNKQGFVNMGTKHPIASNKGKGLIHLSQIESGDILWVTLQDLINHVKGLNADSFRKKSELIYEKDIDPKIISKINSVQAYDDTYLRNEVNNLKTFKADRDDLMFYRKKSVPIETEDLSKELRDIIFAFENDGYDDREIKQEIAMIKRTKMDKSEDVRFRKVEDQILFDDLDENIQSLLESISDNSGSIADLEENKVDRTELENYRHKAISITYADLDDYLQTLLDNFEPYDDTVVQYKLVELENKKADKVDLDTKADADLLALYREKAVKIEFDDLDDNLKSILDDIPEDFNPVQLQIQINKLNEDKADRTELENYRSKAELIKDNDLSPTLLDKINSSDNPYDDTFVWDAINELESSKVDYVTLSNYIQDRDESVTMSNLHRDVQATINNKVNIGQLHMYRRNDVDIEESDLSEVVRRKLNKDQEIISELGDRITALEEQQEENEDRFNDIEESIDEIKDNLNSKLDEEYAEDTYRKKTDLVYEDDLDKELVDKINALPSDSNLGELQDKVNFLSDEIVKKVNEEEFELLKQEIETATGDEESLSDKLETKLEKEQTDELYRNLNTPIATKDLSADVVIKLNKATNDHTEMTNKNGEDEFQHITLLERNKFNEYENIIARLSQRIIDLEEHLGLQTEPTVISSSVDGKPTVELDTKTITYEISGDRLTLDKPELITMQPDAIKGIPTLRGNTLTIKLEDLEESTQYTITIGENALKNGDIPNKKAYTTKFLTEERLKPPVINNSIFNGTNNVSLSTKEVTFSITSSEDVTLDNPSLITMNPNCIQGDILLEGKTLKVPVDGLVETTTYTITIPEGVISNGKENEGLVDVFTTEDVKTKPIISDSDLHNRKDVLISTTKMTFPVSVGEKLVLADKSKIKANKNIIKSVSVDSGDLELTLHNLEYETLYNVTIEEGALQDGDDLFNDLKINSFTTEVEVVKPVILDSEGYNENEDVDFTIEELKFTIDSKKDLVYDDLQTITLKPDAIDGVITIDDRTLTIPVNLVQLTDYELNIPEGLIQAGSNGLYNDELNITFRTNKEMFEPNIHDCQLNGKNDVDIKTTKAIFPVDVHDTLVIEDESKIVVTPNAKVSDSQIVRGKLEVLLGDLQEGTKYTITIKQGALRDGDMLTNSVEKVNTFTTITLPKAPIVNNSDVEGRDDVPVETDKITFPITAETDVTITDEDLIVVEPDVKVESNIVDDNLEVTIENLEEETEYTVTIKEGAIQDDRGLVNEEVVNTFTTAKPTPPPGEAEVEWEYTKLIDSIATSKITFAEIEQATGVTLEPDGMDFYIEDPEVDPDGDIVADPKVVVEYWGSPAKPTEGQRVPRLDIDDGSVCPELPMPTNKPDNIEFYTLGHIIVDTGVVNFEAPAMYSHVVKVRKYKK